MRPPSPLGQFLTVLSPFPRPGCPHSAVLPAHFARMHPPPRWPIRGHLLLRVPRASLHCSLPDGSSPGQLGCRRSLVSSSAASPCPPCSSPASSSSGKTSEHLGVFYSKTHEYIRFTLDFPRKSVKSSASSPESCASETRNSTERVLFGVIGVSAHAAEELGEVVYVEFPRHLAQAGKGDTAPQVSKGREDEHEDAWVKKGTPICSLESVKSVAEVYSPMDGFVVEVNGKVMEQPGLVFQDPEGHGWLMKLQLTQEGEAEEGSEEERARAALAKVTKRLMDAERYATFVEREKSASAFEDSNQ
ncbi:Glycine cleavage system H protein, mitochondrial (Precursor), related [Neospora caninum Liverpool]|uniref:Glycine cleavage system H protein, mitochondrial (Precursor), related n=1 Tax=Neospora caninum (strain Liverpool) TaxID=572307 RepID=F0VFB3_NEOCL|nr:Glycine cleavage system H protein, mitochondrial (Precursor), related [Neospora caninum Liverpool]CBZ52407.1 Glycine cleavage system H protein, mitochondrial (Precursor), related [Neospora caninum Liverpool]CEL66379.1 TPA: Glycine cleavage system H protein, mitochondrial (Precursor), related [Neospora caninum Liverpool]|eukprot:XP_003882439.1 Glycine cleavage system H protein, mitochondrial (Precursor), related [Neospora caninum Liverpool]